MKREVVLSRRAKFEIQEAYLWYEKEREGLGEQFMAKVGKTLDMIGKHPQVYTQHHPPYRQANVRIFPYQVIFVVEGNQVVVECFSHTGRDPKYKYPIK